MNGENELMNDYVPEDDRQARREAEIERARAVRREMNDRDDLLSELLLEVTLLELE